MSRGVGEPLKTVTYSGRTMAIKQWAEETGLSQSVIYMRLNSGWPIAEALGYEPHVKAKIGQTRKNPCGGCRHYKGTSGAKLYRYCDLLNDTGILRGKVVNGVYKCPPPELCEYYTPLKARKQKMN